MLKEKCDISVIMDGAGKIYEIFCRKRGINFQKKIMSSSFYPAGSGCVVQCLPVGGAKVMQITADCQTKRHLLAEGCILFVGPKVFCHNSIR